MASEKEVKVPLMSDYEQSTTLDNEKRDVADLEANQVAPPALLNIDSTRRGKWVAINGHAIRNRIVLLPLLAFLAIHYIRFSCFKQPEHSVAFLEDASPEGSYWRGVATKGMRFALSSSKDHKHGKHHKDDDKHKHHDHHDKHRGGRHPHFIPPKLAEKIFLDVPHNASAAAALRRYTAYAHPAGSGYDFISALNLKNEWETALGIPASGPQEHLYEAGSPESQESIRGNLDKLGVWVDTYYPVLNYPVSSSVTLHSDPPFKAKLREDIVEGDPDSVLRDEVPVFHGLSVSGDVTGQYVYAGYGRKQDFDLLKEKGVDVTGKIVLVKYWKVFRGLKVKAAQEAGAIGVLIFTDPGDDGEKTEANGYAVYPDGPARQPSSVQRGSVQFLSKYPGDPSTPGEPAYKNATRVEGGNYPSIPSLPISYEDAIPLLKALEGKGIHAEELGSDWTGGLGYHGVDYFVGPSEVDLHLVNEVNTRVTPIWNTMAVIPGHIKDEVVVFGNHRDAWVLGGSDPNAGTTAQYEVIRGLGKLLEKGWKPLRTILLASWDAEEYGLIGSTEWAEDFGDWLGVNSVVYLNLDSAASGGNFGAGGSPTLANVIREAAQEITSSLDPSKSVYATKFDAGSWEAYELAKVGALPADFDEWASVAKGYDIEPLGSGSDFTPFLQRYGVASLDLGYSGGPQDPVYHYHSIYDSFTWQAKYGDVGFHRHTDVAKVIGLILLRLVDSVILPFNTTQYAHDLGHYLKQVEDVADAAAVTAELHLDSLHDSIQAVYKASERLDVQREKALEKLHKLLPKPHKPHHGHRVFEKSKKDCQGEHESKEVVSWREYASAKANDKAFPQIPHPNVPVPHLPSPSKIKEIKAVLKEIRGINKKLQHFESGFLSEEGLKDREWYKHKGVAPGVWLGYGATTFPALTEALTIDHSVSEAQKEADELTKLINGIAKRLSA